MRTRWSMGGLALVAVAATALANGDERLVTAAALPVKAQALRDRGVPDADVAEAVRAAKDKGLSAADAEEMLDAADDAAKDNGRIDHFGDFVQSKLDEGLRGRDLAEAIRAEHEARGIGGGKEGKHGKGKAPDGEEGGPDAAPGEGGEGKAGKGKAPEDKGPDGEKGGKSDKAKGGKGKSE